MKERGALVGMLAATTIVGIRCAGIKDIATIVVISAENRSFDSLYWLVPGRQRAFTGNPGRLTQLDRDGSVLKELPRCGAG